MLKIVTERDTFLNLNLQQVGFVATMGNLHAGHLSLCAQSQAENDVTVVSIFVNPTQFNDPQDFAKYPRTLAADKKLLEEQGVDYLFLPTQELLYPDDYHIKITENELGKELEGEYRPGHFDGMLTVVMKLLQCVQPARAYFGEKDYQQLLLVKKMAAAFLLPTEIIGCPIVRAADGLALSSRNARLSPKQREQALHFPRLLTSGLTPAAICQALEALQFKVDYIAPKWQRLLGAVWLDDIRLIDNIPYPTTEG